MNRSRTMTMASAAIIAVLGLSACAGGGGGGGETTAPEAEIGGEIQYAWWGGPARNEKTQAVIDLYQEANPEVTVQGTTAEFAAYFEQATVQAAGKNLPCVPQMQNRLMADYADRGALMPLDDLVDSGAIDVSNIPESVLESGRGSDGNLYMIPYGAAFGSMIVNTTQVEAAGLDLPPEGYDWDWLAEWGADLTKAQGKPSLDLVRSQTDSLEAWMRSHGKDLYEDGQLGFDEGDLVDFWDYVTDLQDSGVAIPAETASEQNSLPLEQLGVSTGNQATVVWPANGLGTAQATIDAAAPGNTLATYPLPTGPDGYGNAFWVSGLAISANCSNVPTAASFIDFFVNDPEAATVYASDNGANVNTENLQLILDDEATTPAKKAELELYAFVADQDVAPAVYGKGYASIFQQNLPRFYQQVAFGELSSKEAAKQFIQEAEAVLG
ncbi:ABC transporter substrate-binding protein [Amnibacterium flavum]|uniref:Carbohydrate ABC transporter substrate-binding protein n=1 Tax=Amnibacterium flavum TaxID=2173173 RepID=A0A2V1HVS8_9MICO|nr:extracellular solute-binding protein [Amnibacterium flavum]PVZ94487.1 carbohydrate ABC transporter substrate-binding protein [Amnibacterium flavum]